MEQLPFGAYYGTAFYGPAMVNATSHPMVIVGGKYVQYSIVYSPSTY